MSLSAFGWVDGITATMVVFLGIIFGIYFLFKGAERDAKQLKRLGLVSILAGLAFFGVFLDFCLVVSLGKNIDNSWGAAALLSYVFIAPLIVLAMYVGAHLHFPDSEKKRHLIIGSYAILGIIFEIIIFLDPFGSFYFGYPKGYPDHPEALIDYNTNLTSVAGVLMTFLMISVLLLLGVGTLINALKLTGDIKKRLLFISFGAFCFGIFGIMEGLTIPGPILIIIRIGYLSSFWFLYYGLS
ncbi:MAG: hypothetical protein ACTSR8_08425 [Promethearchaeota archaeon]